MLVSSAAAQPPTAIDRALAQADQMHARGRIAAARRAWRRLAQRVPNDGRAALRLADVFVTADAQIVTADRDTRARATEARALLEAFVASEGADRSRVHAAQHAIAWTMAATDHRAAIDHASAHAGLQDDTARASLQRLAWVALRRSDLSAARDALRAAHRAMPQDPDVLLELGSIELALGRPDDAIERFQRVVGRDPENLEARRDLAGALIAAGRVDEAVGLLARALDRHAGDAELAIDLAAAALEATQWTLAERASRTAVSLLPADDGRAHALLGAALAAQHRAQEAIAAFREAQRRDPDDPRARRGLEALDVR